DFASSAKNERADRESFKSDARMGGQAEPLIDIRRDPLHALHLRERVFQVITCSRLSLPQIPSPTLTPLLRSNLCTSLCTTPASTPLAQLRSSLPPRPFHPQPPTFLPTPPGGGGAGDGEPWDWLTARWRSGSGGGGGTGGGGSVRGQGGELLDVVLLWEYRSRGQGMGVMVGPAYGVSSVAAATASASTSAGGGGGGTASGAATGAAASAGSGSAADNASAANAGSTAASAAVRWRMDGPSYLQHDFSSNPTCPVSLTLLLRNCSSSPASAAVHTFDPALLPAVEKMSMRPLWARICLRNLAFTAPTTWMARTAAQ
ncbi:unnamed protein product, partial [Closterium sp. NIES-65]